MTVFSLLIAQAALAAPVQPATLLPSGKWQVEYSKSSCVISREFGKTPNITIFGLTPPLNSEFVTLIIAQPSQKGRAFRGEANVRLSGGFVADPAGYVTFTAKGKRVTRIGISREVLDLLAKGESISIRADRWVDVALQPSAFPKALASLKECEADLLAGWGFDRAAQAAVARRPKGTLQGLLRHDDYPSQLVALEVEGTVGFRLRVEADGSISECVAMQSSGSTELDKHTCNLMKKRAKYEPALGHDGKPLWTFVFGWSSWFLE